MLWVVASLLTLVEDVFSEEDSKEAQADLQRVLRQPPWSPAEHLDQDSSIHTPWPEAVGKYFIFLFHQQRYQHGYNLFLVLCHL